MTPEPPLLAVEGLRLDYRLPGRWHQKRRRVTVLNEVGFAVGRGEILGLVGESGAGKSSIARIIGRLLTPAAGRISFDGDDWLALSGRVLRERRRHLQMIFQSASSALDPRWRVLDSLAEPLRSYTRLRGEALRQRANRLLEEIGLHPDILGRYPHQLSGGQRQRIAIARALAVRPKLLIADEPVSALDTVSRAQILALFRRLRGEDGMSLLLISHDLTAIRQLCDRVAVIERGEVKIQA